MTDDNFCYVRYVIEFYKPNFICLIEILACMKSCIFIWIPSCILISFMFAKFINPKYMLNVEHI